MEIRTVPQPNRYVNKTVESVVRYDGGGDIPLGDGGEGRGKPDSGLPESLVVRLCFAISLLVGVDGTMTPCLSPDGQRPPSAASATAGGPVQAGRGRVWPPTFLEVPVKVGHVLLSDLVRQQLEVRQCSRVVLRHVQDAWRMSFVDQIKVVLQPLNYDKVK